MMSIRSLADFNRSSLGGDSDWLAPPPSPPRPHTSGRHGERGMGTFNWPPARTSTWPYTGTFSWPRTLPVRVLPLIGKRILGDLAGRDVESTVSAGLADDFAVYLDLALH